MECVYDTEGDRRRKSAAIEKEHGSENPDSLVTRLRNASSENEVGAIVKQIRTNGTTAATTAAVPPPTTISGASTNGQVWHGNRKASFADIPRGRHNHHKESPERIIVQDMGKLQIDELGDLRHFGYTSSLESIHSWPRSGSASLTATAAAADHTIPRPGPSWTNVTSDQDLISELLVRSGSPHPVPLQPKAHLLTVQ